MIHIGHLRLATTLYSYVLFIATLNLIYLNQIYSISLQTHRRRMVRDSVLGTTTTHDVRDVKVSFDVPWLIAINIFKNIDTVVVPLFLVLMETK